MRAVPGISFSYTQHRRNHSTKPPKLFGRDGHWVDRGHARLSGAAADEGDVLTFVPRLIVLTELVVDSCQQEMGLAVFGVELRRSRQLRTRVPKASKFEQRLARKKV